MYVDWFPAITTTSLLAGVLWLAKNAIQERLKGAVQHEFNEKLEKFKSELQEKENQITVLRSSVLTTASHRHTILNDRKLKAVEDIWGAVISMAAAKNISSMFSQLNFGALSKETVRNPQAREIWQVVGAGFDFKAVDTISACRSRPFLSKSIWAYYSAYKAIVFQSVVRLESLKAGAEDDWSKGADMIALAKVALPHKQEYIEKYGAETLHYLLDELEAKILEEIDNFLIGNFEDIAHLESAAKILHASDQLMKND